MKSNLIYTYYENVSFELQNELLDIWQKSWSKYNFEPIVLSRDDAKKSPLFQQYYDFVQRVHEKSVGSTLPESEYCLAAQLEIVGFHTIEKPSFISDYDMINNGFTTEEQLESTVHWRNGACSCFASGDKNGWEKYINFLFKQEDIIVDWCKKESASTSRTKFHDQDFLVAVTSVGLEKNIYKMSRNLDILGCDYDPQKNVLCKIPHLSHRNMKEIKQKYSEYSECTQDQIRVMFATKILNNNCT